MLMGKEEFRAAVAAQAPGKRARCPIEGHAFRIGGHAAKPVLKKKGDRCRPPAEKIRLLCGFSSRPLGWILFDFEVFAADLFVEGLGVGNFLLAHPDLLADDRLLFYARLLFA